MKKPMIAFRSLMVASTLMLVLGSCGKEKQEESMKDAKDSTLGEQLFDDMNDMADEAATGELISYKLEAEQLTYSSCAVKTHDTLSEPRVLTIDFGTGCMGNDGRMRSGLVTITYSGPYAEPGHLHTITTTNYVVDGNQVEGTITVFNEGLNANNHLWFTKTVNATITKEDGEVLQWQANRTKEWIEGFTTIQRLDDIYLVSGTHAAQSSDGTSFTSLILEPLRKVKACSWKTAGVVEVTKTDKPVKTINFGDGTCDNDAVVTVNGNDFAIQLN
jgi:hypothetical protein